MVGESDQGKKRVRRSASERKLMPFRLVPTWRGPKGDYLEQDEPESQLRRAAPEDLLPVAARNEYEHFRTFLEDMIDVDIRFFHQKYRDSAEAWIATGGALTTDKYGMIVRPGHRMKTATTWPREPKELSSAAAREFAEDDIAFSLWSHEYLEDETLNRAALLLNLGKYGDRGLESLESHVIKFVNRVRDRRFSRELAKIGISKAAIARVGARYFPENLAAELTGEYEELFREFAVDRKEGLCLWLEKTLRRDWPTALYAIGEKRGATKWNAQKPGERCDMAEETLLESGSELELEPAPETEAGTYIERLNKLRHEIAESWETVALGAGVGVRTLAETRKGDSNPSDTTRRRLSRYFSQELHRRFDFELREAKRVPR